MKTIVFLLLLLSPCFLFAQNVTSGQVIDEATNQPLAYVNIGVVGAGRGTVSNDAGNFSLRLPTGFDQETLKLSILGYESLSFTVAEFRRKIGTDKKISLKPIGIDLQQVVVVPRFTKTKRFGNRAQTKKLTDGFDGDLLGREGGIIVKLGKRYRPGVITEFRAFIVSNPYKEIKFRLNFYRLKNGRPGKPLSRKSIIITSKIKNGVLEANLEEYDIVVDDDFAMTLEWIEDFELAGKYRMGGLRFAMRRFGPTCVFRYASQDRWQAYSGLLAPSPCVNVTVGYR